MTSGIIFLFMDSSISYNRYLFEKRCQLNLSKRKFARYLGISPFRYRLIEQGYIKPSKKETKKLSDGFGFDFTCLSTSIHSYPEEMEEEGHKFQDFFYRICSSKILRSFFAILTVFFLSFSIFGFVQIQENKKNILNNFSSEYVEFYDQMKEKGYKTYSVLSSFERPAISMSEGSSFASIITSYKDINIENLDCYVDYFQPNSKLNYTISVNSFRLTPYIMANYSDYVTMESFQADLVYNSNTKEFDVESIYSYDYDLKEGSEKYLELKEIVSSHKDEVISQLERLIENKLSLKVDFMDLVKDYSIGSSSYTRKSIKYLVISILSSMLFSLFLFALCFALVFGIHRKGELFELTNSSEKNVFFSPKRLRKERELKTDFRFTPFLPETLFEIAGILLTFFGSLRILYYVFIVLSSADSISGDFQTSANFLFMIFTIGMFLLYFIDFDIFLNDKRSLRNVFLYGIIFFCLYYIESLCLTEVADMNNVIFNRLIQIPIPNNFGTISCYFLIMIFLFMTPRWVDTKKKLVFYRFLSLIPLLIICVNTIISLEYTNWGWELDYFQRGLFSSERPQFSFLCISYLFGLYFLRLYFRHKYGEEKARRYFLSNRFFFLKNILVVILIVIIAVSEFFMKNFSPNNVKGFGRYWQIIFLAPFLLFYHPHIGKRNKPFDWFIMGLYIFFFGFAYILIGMFVLFLVIRMF